jgi:hypothetical protein
MLPRPTTPIVSPGIAALAGVPAVPGGGGVDVTRISSAAAADARLGRAGSGALYRFQSVPVSVQVG